MERLYLSPGETIDAYSTAGRTKLRRSASSLLLLGILAGAIIAVAAAATNTAVTGAELFTGNCMLPITLLDGGGTIGQMLRNWVLVYIGNTLGALLVAGLCVFCGQLDYSSGALAVYTIRVGAGKCALPFWNGLGLGILCNVLVCLGVLAANSAKDTAGRLLGAYLPVCFFVLCGFEHSVADLYYIGAALMAAAVPEHAAQAVAAGVDLAPLGMAGAVSALIPVTLGNILGGAGLGALLWYCHGARGRSGR